MALIGISGKKNSGRKLTASIIQYLIWKEEVEKGSSTSLHYTLRSFTENKLGNALSGWQSKSISDSIKGALSVILHCPVTALDDKAFLETELSSEWWYYQFEDGTKIAHSEIGFLNPIVKDTTIVRTTPKILLQLLSIECGTKIIHPNIWLISLFSQYKPLYKGTSYDSGTINGGYHHLHCKSCNKSYTGHKRQYYCKECIEDDNIVVYPNWIITDMSFLNKNEVEKRGGITININRGETPFEDPFITSFNYVIDNNGSVEELIEKVRQILTTERIIS